MHVGKHLTITLLCASIFGSADGLAGSEPTSELGPRIGAAAKAKKLPLRENMQKNYHYEAWKVGDRFVHWRLVRNKDGQVMHKAYPYDKTALSGVSPMKRYGFKQFHALLKARMRVKTPKAPLVVGAPTTLNARAQPNVVTPIVYQTGLPLGANPSTGLIATSANCFNSTTTLNNAISQLSFSSSNSATSFSGQTNVSASISGSVSTAVASGSVNDVFTFANNYSSAATSGAIYYTAYQTYETNNTFYSLTQTGNNAQATSEFSTDCGSNFVSNVPVGMLITGQASYSAQTTAASQSIANSFNASVNGKVGTLASFSATVSNAYSNSSQNNGSSYNFGYSAETIGGGEAAAAIFDTQYAQQATPYLASCSQGNITACNSFVAGADAASLQALTVFQNCFNTSGVPITTGTYACPSSTASDITAGIISGLAVFPNGVAGVPNIGTVVANQSIQALINASSNPQYTDIMGPYKTQLLNYLNIYNEVATLYSRAMYLGNTNSQYTLGKINQLNNFGGYTQSFNPTPIIDIAGSYFSPLINLYSADLQAIIGNLNACITSTSSTASSNCQPIVEAYNKNVTSAYGWYGTNLNGNGVSNNNFALQNTIALQYSGTINSSGGNFPLDVIWVQGFPTATFSQTVNSLPSGTTSPAGLPGLIAFADQPYTWNISTPPPTNFNSPFAQLIPTTSSTTTISTPTSSYVPYTYYLADYGNLGILGWQLNTGAASTISYGNGATTVGFNAPPSITTVNGSNITGLSATAQFFGPSAGGN